MTPRERWLTAVWPFVRSNVPLPPGRVVDIGCGPHGGFVPMLREDGYDAIGIDPKAPEEEHYQRVEFERAVLPERIDAVVASTSLHHVDDPAEVVDRIVDALPAGGLVVVIEWAWEQFDAETAEWCFARLRDTSDEGWLHRRRNGWLASGLAWPEYLRGWAEQQGVHRGYSLVRLLDERLERRALRPGAYFFPDLADTTEADERAAINAGAINATRIDYVAIAR
jgi:SAM-dependent methyltransferase